MGIIEAHRLASHKMAAAAEWERRPRLREVAQG
jgi:hypothetical protein